MSGITRSSSISAICSPRGPLMRSSAGWPPGAVTTVMPLRLIAASSKTALYRIVIDDKNGLRHALIPN